MTPIRILLVDDHPVVRSGIRAMLAGQPDFELVGEATTGEEGTELAHRLAPDVVLMDLQLGPGIHGSEATRRIVALGGPRVLVLTTFDTDADPAFAALVALSFVRWWKLSLTSRARSASVPGWSCGAPCSGAHTASPESWASTGLRGRGPR